MIWLWIAAALVSAGLAALIVLRAARAAAGVRPGQATDSAGDLANNPALAVYRRQMAELDELADRGLLAEAERRSVRAETGRRLLAAADRADTPQRAATPGLVLALATATPVLAIVGYIAVGAPSVPDQPFKARLAEWRDISAREPQSLSTPQMAAVLRDLAAQKPTDPLPLQNLALAELASGEPTEAEVAAQHALSLQPKNAGLWELLGETLVAQSGDVGSDAQEDFHKALALDPTSVTARYYLGRARIEAGDMAGGIADWRTMLAAMPLDDPRRPELSADILRASEARSGPPAGAAGGVGPAQIQGMVDGLAARLKASPDDPDGWVRLVRAYAVLGEADRRDAALAQARQRYAGHADILQQLDAATHPPTAPPATIPAAQ